MIHSDMSFLYMAGIAAVLLFAAIGLIAFSVALFRAMNDPQDYAEDDEFKFRDWQDRHKTIEAWRNEQ